MKKIITLILAIILPIFICSVILSTFSNEDFTLIGYENNPIVTSIAKYLVEFIMIFAIVIYTIYTLLWCVRMPGIISSKNKHKIKKYLIYALCQVGIFIISVYHLRLYHGLIVSHIITFNITTLISLYSPSLKLPNMIRELRDWAVGVNDNNQ